MCATCALSGRTLWWLSTNTLRIPEEEIELLRTHCNELGVGFAVNNAFSQGGEGAVELAQLVADTVENNPSKPLQFTRIPTVCSKDWENWQPIYGASIVTYSSSAMQPHEADRWIGHLALSGVYCQNAVLSFSADPKIYGAVNNFEFHIKDIVINNGAEMIVAIAGEILRMPGLPKEPQAQTHRHCWRSHWGPQLIPVRQQHNWLRATTKLVIAQPISFVHGL